MRGMRRFLRDNGLSLFIAGLFLLMMMGQAFTGLRQYNEEREERNQHRPDAPVRYS